MDLTDEERKEKEDNWLKIVKGYETLTDKNKF